MRYRLTFLKVLAVGVDELQGNQLEPTLLEASNNVTDETALDAVGLMITMRPSRRCTERRAIKSEGDRTLTMIYVRSLLLGMIDTFCSG